jgi:hypothetical protein
MLYTNKLKINLMILTMINKHKINSTFYKISEIVFKLFYIKITIFINRNKRTLILSPKLILFEVGNCNFSFRIDFDTLFFCLTHLSCVSAL